MKEKKIKRQLPIVTNASYLWKNFLNSSKSWFRHKDVNNTYYFNEVIPFQEQGKIFDIWYRGDENELANCYVNFANCDNNRFWKSMSSKGNEIRKIHVDVPAVIVNVLSNMIVNDYNGITFTDTHAQDLWNDIAKEIKEKNKLQDSLKKTFIVGDCAFKWNINPRISDKPILQVVSGTNVNYVTEFDKVIEVDFVKYVAIDERDYKFVERYGYGYIIYELYNENNVLIEDFRNIYVQFSGFQDLYFDPKYIFAFPMIIFPSGKYENRGQSVFQGKDGLFDALDECISQWMDALRDGRTRTFIPECYIPRDEDSFMLKPNPFDNKFMVVANDMTTETATNKIQVEQAQIQAEAYLSTYLSIFELCIQGVISSGTMGVDNKKLDNATAQREKEKVTQHTRTCVLTTLEELLPQMAQAGVVLYQVMKREQVMDYDCHADFNEFNAPTMESEIESVGKAVTYGVMTKRTAIETMHKNNWTWEEIEKEIEELANEELRDETIKKINVDTPTDLQQQTI